MSNSCFVATCTFKMSILLYSKTAHEGNKHVKFMSCNNMYIKMSILWYSETVGNGKKLFRFMFASKLLI